jgi:Raf kinase inhibitor-like YbhB/YbcL family protein
MLAAMRLALAFALFVALIPRGAFAANFEIISPAFKDGDAVTSIFAFTGSANDGTPCGGGGQSPPLAWSGAPDGTKSYALVVFDPEGASGAGVAHWVYYGIPAEVSALPEGIGSSPNPPYVNGINVTGKPGYRGFCPPHGQTPHHYLLTLFATDLAPDALAPGLTRAQLLAALDKHVLSLTSIVARFGR